MATQPTNKGVTTKPTNAPTKAQTNNATVMVNARKEMKTADNKVFTMQEMAVTLANTYKTLIPDYAQHTINYAGETHDFMQMLLGDRYIDNVNKPLITTVTWDSVENSFKEFIRSGVSLSSKQANLIPYGKELKFSISAKGNVYKATSMVKGLERIVATVVFKGEEISSHFERGVEFYDHKRNMKSRIDDLEYIEGVYGYAIDENGVIIESSWKSILTLLKDWISNNHNAFKDSKTKKKVYPKDIESYLSFLSDNHINRPEAMAKKTMEASLAAILTAKYPHNEMQQKYLENIIVQSELAQPKLTTPIIEDKVYNIDEPTQETAYEQPKHTDEQKESQETDYAQDTYYDDLPPEQEEQLPFETNKTEEDFTNDTTRCVVCGANLSEKSQNYYAEHPTYKRTCFKCGKK